MAEIAVDAPFLAAAGRVIDCGFWSDSVSTSTYMEAVCGAAVQ